jgi:hypothetical protein
VSAVVVAGALANKPGSSGEAWVRMSWARGLASLGLDVWFVEQLDDPADPDPAALDWFHSVTDSFGLGRRASLLSGDEALVGPELDELVELAAEASLVNISGHLTLPGLMHAFRRRVMIDIDPGFTQFWHAAGLAGANVEGHDAYFTIGELIGTPGCPIPTSGIDWQPVRQPVFLEDWPVGPAPEPDRFTTVATWRGPFGPIEHAGRTYGLKVHEFRKFMSLPQKSPHRFELALDIHPSDSADLEQLRAHGWEVVDPGAAAGDPESFRAYIQGSGSEFSVAQGVYVDTACGWFSDRTSRYLASARPALIQDTGFSRILPVGEGLVAFTTLEEAVAGANDLVARHEEHSAAARRIAAEHFAAPTVLAAFCERAGIDRPGR